jgi:uncharacterized membrane protein YhdT
MIAPDPVSLRTADRDLAQTATVSSILYLVAWLVVIYTTEVSGELPLVSISGIVLLGLAFAIRLVLGAAGNLPTVRLSQLTAASGVY